ncbi:MAG: M56 family metallopeptidase [Saprospiraceae bacterium]|nr:M56 family metallopeptidase [Saprospiraceae bacterium]
MISDMLLPQPEIINALVWTLLHSVWQFALIALLMSFLLKRYETGGPEKRYFIALVSLLVAFFTGVGTFLYYLNLSASDHTNTFMQTIQWSENGSLAANGFSDDLFLWIERHQHLIFYFWISGVILFSIRFILAALYSEFLSSSFIHVYCQDTFKAFKKVSQHYNIHGNIKIGASKYVTSPLILGFVKPIILFPVSLINQLDIRETEAILAHELAHFVRKDLYVNVVQNLIEVILFYHPAIWWISANIKLERESCCDDMATQYLGDKLLYAKTLLKIQEMSQNHSQPALAMYYSKKESFFSNRIKRILNMTQTRNYLKEKIFTSVLLILIMMVATKNLSGTSDKNQKDNTLANQNIFVSPNTIDSIPNKKESVRIQKRTNDKDYKIAIEDGKITELEVDGKKIDEKDYDKYEDIIAEAKPGRSGDGSKRMFFFDGDHDGPMVLRFGQNPDSFWYDYKTLKDFPGKFRSFDFNNDMLDENIKQQLKEYKILMEDFRGKMFDKKHFEDMQKSYGITEEQMKNMQKQMENFRFNFKDLDSMGFGLREFKFPEFNFEDFNGFKIHPFGDENEDILERINPEARTNNFSDALGNALNKDGLLIPGQENKVELSGKHLKINGEKQPNNIYQKYKRIFEEASGSTLEKNSKLQFNFLGKESKRKFRVY